MNHWVRKMSVYPFYRKIFFFPRAKLKTFCSLLEISLTMIHSSEGKTILRGANVFIPCYSVALDVAV